MKNLLLILVISPFFLSACNVGSNELFQKKLECEKYKNEIEEAAQQNFATSGTKVEKIFYSTKRNSCLYLSKNVLNLSHLYKISDYLTREELYFNYCTECNLNNKECKNIFNACMEEIEKEVQKYE